MLLIKAIIYFRRKPENKEVTMCYCEVLVPIRRMLQANSFSLDKSKSLEEGDSKEVVDRTMLNQKIKTEKKEDMSQFNY